MQTAKIATDLRIKLKQMTVKGQLVGNDGQTQKAQVNCGSNEALEAELAQAKLRLAASKEKFIKVAAMKTQ